MHRIHLLPVLAVCTALCAATGLRAADADAILADEMVLKSAGIA